MKKKGKENLFGNLPCCVEEFVKLVIRKMGYRRKVREEVREELVCHFEDELRESESDEAREEACEKLIAEFGDAKLLGKLLRRAKKRCRPLWRTVAVRTFQAIGILLLCLAVYIGWFISGEPSITTDYVAQWNRLVRPVAERNQNAAPFYIEAAGLSKEWPDDMLKLFGEKYQDVNDVQKQRIEQFLEDNRDTLELIVAGSKKPYYWREYTTSQSNTREISALSIPNTGEFACLVDALWWRARLLSKKGRFEQAFEDLKASFRFGRHLRGDKTILEQLVGIDSEKRATAALLEILSKWEFNSTVLTELQIEFQKLLGEEDFVVNCKLQTLLLYDELQRGFTGKGLGNGHLYFKRFSKWSESIGDESVEYMIMEQKGSWLAPLWIFFTHPDKKETRKMIGRYFDFHEEIARKNPAEIRAEGIDIQKQQKEIIKDNLLLKILAPSFNNLIKHNYDVKAQTEAVITVLGLLRYREDAGDYPDSLDELMEDGYIYEVPIDPFSNREIIYRKKDGDFILYSVGFDFDDDGGTVAKWPEDSIRHTDNNDKVFWPVGK